MDSIRPRLSALAGKKEESRTACPTGTHRLCTDPSAPGTVHTVHTVLGARGLARGAVVSEILCYQANILPSLRGTAVNAALGLGYGRAACE